MPSVLPGTWPAPRNQRVSPTPAQQSPTTMGPRMNQSSRFAHSANNGGNAHTQRSHGLPASTVGEGAAAFVAGAAGIGAADTAVAGGVAPGPPSPPGRG